MFAKLTRHTKCKAKKKDKMQGQLILDPLFQVFQLVGGGREGKRLQRDVVLASISFAPPPSCLKVIEII